MTGLVLEGDEGRVRVLTLNRPEQRNALSAELRVELIQCLQEAENDAGVGAIVLTGAGPAFAAGADLSEMAARSADEQRHFLQPPHVYSVIEGLRKPVVAAINGHALGAGLELATACDVRVCAEGAKLGQPEIGLALIPGGGGTQRLFRQVGKGAASRLVLTGQAIDADEAFRLRLVDVLVAPGEAVPRAVEVAAAMARHDPAALAAAKRALAAARELPYREGLEREIELFMGLHGQPASRTAVQAFLARR
jgi:enoyl-CoA hydratase